MDTDGAADGPGEGDAVEHLWNAAHEMLRAMRTLVDAADEFVESQRGARSPARRDRDRDGDRGHESGARPARVHRIHIDGDADTGTGTGRF